MKNDVSEDLSSAILQTIAEKTPISPLALLNVLEDRYSSAQVKETLLELLRSGQIQMTADRHLVAVPVAA